MVLQVSLTLNWSHHRWSSIAFHHHEWLSLSMLSTSSIDNTLLWLAEACFQYLRSADTLWKGRRLSSADMRDIGIQSLFSSFKNWAIARRLRPVDIFDPAGSLIVLLCYPLKLIVWLWEKTDFEHYFWGEDVALKKLCHVFFIRPRKFLSLLYVLFHPCWANFLIKLVFKLFNWVRTVFVLLDRLIFEILAFVFEKFFNSLSYWNFLR